MDQPHRILVIDDDPGVLTMMVEVLHHEGYEVAPAPGPTSALMLQFVPDLILTDLQMSIMDGWEFLAVLQLRSGRDVPVIVVSAFADRAAVSWEAGAVAFLAKPFRLEALLQTVAQHTSPVRPRAAANACDASSFSRGARQCATPR